MSYLVSLDLTASRLARLVTAPTTGDKDRYARSLRQEITSLADDVERLSLGGALYEAGEDVTGNVLATQAGRVYSICLEGALRLISRDAEISQNRQIAADALDMMRALVPGTEWRSEMAVRTKDGALKIVRPSDLVFDPELTNCFCYDDAEDSSCGAAVHDAL